MNQPPLLLLRLLPLPPLRLHQMVITRCQRLSPRPSPRSRKINRNRNLIARPNRNNRAICIDSFFHHKNKRQHQNPLQQLLVRERRRLPHQLRLLLRSPVAAVVVAVAVVLHPSIFDHPPSALGQLSPSSTQHSTIAKQTNHTVRAVALIQTRRVLWRPLQPLPLRVWWSQTVFQPRLPFPEPLRRRPQPLTRWCHHHHHHCLYCPDRHRLNCARRRAFRAHPRNRPRA